MGGEKCDRHAVPLRLHHGLPTTPRLLTRGEALLLINRRDSHEEPQRQEVMPKAATQAPPAHAHLAHLLNDLGVASARAPKKPFADRLAELIDLSGAIDLSEFLRGLPRVQVDEAVAKEAQASEAEQDGDPRARFLAQRAEMIQHITASFTLDPAAKAGSPTGFILPTPGVETLGDDTEAYAPYQRFYALHQSEMERRVHALRRSLRKQLGAASTALAQLAALDTTLDATLADYSRRSLAVLPTLLARHFFALRRAQEEADAETERTSQPEDWLGEGGWLTQFHRDMQRLLLAELSLRLQPLQGMQEALDFDHEDTP